MMDWMDWGDGWMKDNMCIWVWIVEGYDG